MIELMLRTKKLQIGLLLALASVGLAITGAQIADRARTKDVPRYRVAAPTSIVRAEEPELVRPGDLLGESTSDSDLRLAHDRARADFAQWIAPLRQPNPDLLSLDISSRQSVEVGVDELIDLFPEEASGELSSVRLLDAGEAGLRLAIEATYSSSEGARRVIITLIYSRADYESPLVLTSFNATPLS